MNRADKAATNSKLVGTTSLEPTEQRQTLTIQQAIDLGLQHHSAGDLPKAESTYQQILKAEPNQPVALHLLGVIAHQVGKNDVAVGLIEKALAIIPDYAEAHINLGNALKEQGNLDDAVASYHKALAIKPNSAEAHNNLGFALQEQGKLDDAAASYHKSLAIEPNYTEAHINLGNVLQAQRKLEDAAASYYKALAITPNSAEAHNNLGNTLEEQGKLDDAVACYHKALGIRPDYAEAYSNLGNALNEQGKLDDAIASFHKALVIKPNHAEALNNLGNALKEQRKLDDAIASYHKALAIKLDFYEAYNNLGFALQEQGKLGDAIANYHKSLAIKPSYAQAYNNLKFALKAHQASSSSDDDKLEFGSNRSNVTSNNNVFLALQQFYLDGFKPHEAGGSFDKVTAALPALADEAIPIHFAGTQSTDIAHTPNKLVALLSYGRSGTGLLHSLIDGHPEISTLPSVYLRGYFNSGVWDKLIANGWQGLPERFADEFAVLFDARTSNPIPTRLGETSTFIGRKEGMTSVGDNRDEFLSIERTVFCRSATRQLEHMESVDPMSFLRVVHAAYDDVTGMTPVSDTTKQHCFYHIHNPDDYAKSNFLRYAPEARLLMMVREPIQNCESAIRQDFHKNDYDKCVHHLHEVMFGFDQVLFRMRKSAGLRLEDLKARPEASLRALCSWIGVKESPTLYEMTAQGKKWWGDPSSPSYSNDKAMSPFGDAPMKHAANTTFGETDQFVLKTLFYPFRVRFGYCEPEPAQFQKDLKTVRPLLNEMLGFEKAMADRMNVDYEQFKRRGSYQLFRAGINDRCDVLDELGTYPHMLRPLNLL